MVTASLTTDVQLAARVLREGGLVAFATETVYGLGADALNPSAVARIFEAKQRPTFDPLIVHIAEMNQLQQVVREVPSFARDLMQKFWPGPLTVVLPKQECVPDLVTAGLSTVGVRQPRHPLALELLRLCGTPIAAPSANPFGGISPTTAEHVLTSLGDRIDLILDGGPCAVGLESTIVSVPASGPPVLYRAGGLPVEDLEGVAGPVIVNQNSSNPSAAQLAPGMLERHYAPGKPIEFTSDWSAAPHGSDIGALTLHEHLSPSRFGHVEVLSPAGDLNEAAARFFAALRRLDAAPVAKIVAEWFPARGLGVPLNDRLRRAAVPPSRE